MDLWEDNYLAHYGIQKQRWGVRRFQNKDGSLTPEGRRRYTDFKRASRAVKEKASNKIMPFIKAPMNLDTVRKRGDISEEEAGICAKIANRLFNRVSKIEPKITKDVVSAVDDSGCTMYGLDKRLKQPTSIASKIGANAKEDNISFEEAGETIKDAIRYTSVSDDSGFVVNYNNIKNALSNKGYTETRCRNYFAFYKEGKVKHKSVQCIFVDSEGNPFEIQFQTYASQAVKDLKVPLYEEARSKKTSASRKNEIEKIMQDLAEQIDYPKDVMSIRSYG